MNNIIYKQLDTRWSNLPYPTKASSFGGNGCGCCACVHIAIEQENKKDWTPATLRPWMVDKGFAYVNQGTTWQGITETLKFLGHREVICVWSAPMSEAWKELDKGNRIGVLLVSNGKTPDGTYWTSSGHYVAFTDYKVQGGQHWFYIKDSGGRNHDGWFCYERSIRGALPKLWIVERLSAPIPTPTPRKGTYTGEYPAPKKYLEKGDKGTEVTKWQKYLNWSFEGQEGFSPMAEDGIYGNDTYTWTVVFQEAAVGAGTGDGKVGPKTIDKAKELGGYVPPEPAPEPTPEPRKYDGEYPNPSKYLEKGDKGTEVRKLQHYINWFFYPTYGRNVIEEDGKYGQLTLNCCCLMQEELGFAPAECNGEVGPKTIAKMKEYGGYVNTLGDLIIEACKIVAYRARKATYGWRSGPCWENIDEEGTCASFDGVVLQYLGYKKKGKYIWHNGRGYGDGKVTGATKRMDVIYMKNRQLKNCKNLVLKGDLLLFDDSRSGVRGDGGHVCFASGAWDGDDCLVWDIGKKMICEKTGEPRPYDGSHKLLAIVRLKG